MRIFVDYEKIIFKAEFQYYKKFKKLNIWFHPVTNNLKIVIKTNLAEIL